LNKQCSNLCKNLGNKM